MSDPAYDPPASAPGDHQRQALLRALRVRRPLRREAQAVATRGQRIAVSLGQHAGGQGAQGAPISCTPGTQTTRCSSVFRKTFLRLSMVRCPSSPSDLSAPPPFPRLVPAPALPGRKVAMVTSVLDILDLEGRNQGDEIRVGGFDLVRAGGSSSAPVGDTGSGGGVYTTAIGTEIPEQRVDRIPRKQKDKPPTGAGGAARGEASRRHQGSSASGGSRSNAGDHGKSAGASGQTSRPIVRGAGTGSASGCGSSGVGSRVSSLSSRRGARVSSSSGSSRDARGETRSSGRNESRQRGPNRGVGGAHEVSRGRVDQGRGASGGRGSSVRVRRK